MSAIPELELHVPFRDGPYQAYVYAYPHKTAYLEFREPKSIAPLWQRCDTSKLQLYLHVPFCTMRCGFCNLFTSAQPNRIIVSAFLDAIETEAKVFRDCVPDANFLQCAIGGGTPTYLNVEELSRLFALVPAGISTGIEVSPDTLDVEKVRLFQANNVERVSIGIQSFVESEAANSGRPQKTDDVEQSLTLLAEAGFANWNVDLIYGLPGQTIETWMHSALCARTHGPRPFA
jgi:oxygen-independent coproporphyrinogen III oxidase